VTAQAKFLDRILRGTSDKNIEFDALCNLLKQLGFVERVRGDHHIFTKDGITEILNLQPKKHQAKAYQVKQVRKVILQYKLAGEKMQSRYRYEIIIYWSEEDEAYIAEVPELSGCAADGPTYQEALAQAEIVISEWIETAKELGRQIPEPRGRLLFA
jgi:predicted RNase H-like HicB family nuclease/predicted RNA binding protein YcfA (HicA-like mRNA interferase family)